MARQTSMFQIEGTIGELCFYKTKDGYLVRRKSSISRKRMKSHPAFARVRENSAEFGRAAQAGRLFRSAFRALLVRAGIKGQAGNLTAEFLKAIKSDRINDRGLRTVSDGEPQILQGYELNENRQLFNTLTLQYTSTVNQREGITVEIPPFDPALSMKSPAAATHFRFLAGAAALDFTRDSYEVATSESDLLLIDENQELQIRLTQKIKPDSIGPVFVVLGIEFLQVVNGRELPLRSAGANPLAIVRVLNQ